MAAITRTRFEGNSILFWLLCITIVFIPFAIIYLIDGLVIEHGEGKTGP